MNSFRIGDEVWLRIFPTTKNGGTTGSGEIIAIEYPDECDIEDGVLEISYRIRYKCPSTHATYLTSRVGEKLTLKSMDLDRLFAI